MFARTAACALLAVLPIASAPASDHSAGISSVDIHGTEFRITLSDGRVLSGTSLVGAVLTIGVREGETASIRIDGVASDPEDPEVLLYDLSLRDEAGAWKPLCAPDVEGLQKAFPMKGTLA